MAPELMEAMRAVKAKDGISVAVQVDRAVREWLKKRGVKFAVPEKAARKRGGYPQALLARDLFGGPMSVTARKKIGLKDDEYPVNRTFRLAQRLAARSNAARLSSSPLDIDIDNVEAIEELAIYYTRCYPNATSYGDRLDYQAIARLLLTSLAARLALGRGGAR